MEEHIKELVESAQPAVYPFFHLFASTKQLTADQYSACLHSNKPTFFLDGSSLHRNVKADEEVFMNKALNETYDGDSIFCFQRMYILQCDVEDSAYRIVRIRRLQPQLCIDQVVTSGVIGRTVRLRIQHQAARLL